MQWKTADLSKHTYTNDSFSMTYGLETITMVTANGHMISQFLSGMKPAMPRNGMAPNLPTKPPKTVGIFQNGLMNGGTHSPSNIRSVGKKVEQFEAQLKRIRPKVPPRPNSHGAAVANQPSSPKHAPLRPTQSVPVVPAMSSQASPQLARAFMKRKAPSASVSEAEEKGGALYEVPLKLKPPAKKEEGSSESLPEGRYETSDQLEKPSQLPPKSRPLPPPVPKHRKVKILPSSGTTNGPSTTPSIPPPPLPPSSRSRSSGNSEPHTSQHTTTAAVDSDTTCTSPESPIYDDLIRLEYAEPDAHLLASRPRRAKNAALKRKSTTHKPSSSSSSHFSPPPSSPAPPPPPPSSSEVSTLPRVSSSSSDSPPPNTPAPPPPVYDKLSPEDDMREVDDVFEAKDLVMQVRYSHDANPIYNDLAALKVRSSLNTSNVTFHSFSSTLERRKEQSKPPVGLKPQATPTSTTSVNHDYENSELLSLLCKDIPRKAPLHSSPAKKIPENQQQSEKAKLRTPSVSPPSSVIGREKESDNKKAEVPVDDSNAAKSVGTKKSPRLGKKTRKDTAPSYGYSRLEHFSTKSKPTPKPPPLSSSADDDDILNHEYAEVEEMFKRGHKNKRKNATEKKTSEDATDGETPPPVPERPMVMGGGMGGGGGGGGGEEKNQGPQKPPRARQRREKIVEKGGKVHRAFKSSDALKVRVHTL